MRFIQDVAFWVVILIVIYLIAANYRAANTLAVTSFQGFNQSVKTLQGR